jgi:hypothetical protein
MGSPMRWTRLLLAIVFAIAVAVAACSPPQWTPWQEFDDCMQSNGYEPNFDGQPGPQMDANVSAYQACRHLRPAATRYQTTNPP